MQRYVADDNLRHPVKLCESDKNSQKVLNLIVQEIKENSYQKIFFTMK